MQDYTDIKLDLKSPRVEENVSIVQNHTCVKSPSIVTAKMNPSKLMNQISYRSIYNNKLKESQNDIVTITDS